MGGSNSHPTTVETTNRIRKLCVSKNVDYVLDNANVQQIDKEMIMLGLLFWGKIIELILTPPPPTHTHILTSLIKS